MTRQKREAELLRLVKAADTKGESVKVTDLAEALGVTNRTVESYVESWPEHLSLIVGVRVGNMVGTLAAEDREVEWIEEES